jgi:hypothetical protein
VDEETGPPCIVFMDSLNMHLAATIGTNLREARPMGCYCRRACHGRPLAQAAGLRARSRAAVRRARVGEPPRARAGTVPAAAQRGAPGGCWAAYARCVHSRARGAWPRAP